MFSSHVPRDGENNAHSGTVSKHHARRALPGHEGKDKNHDTASAHREHEERAPTAQCRQHHDGQSRPVTRSGRKMRRSDTGRAKES